MPGPLEGITVVELAGMGPTPFCAMMLADMGADVVRVDRFPTEATPAGSRRTDLLNRGKRSIAVDLKAREGVEAVLRLVAGADALIEGFRPGVTERLGLGPDECLAVNPALVYGRTTGWGQDGPLAARAGHDINYIALSGVLSLCARRDQPPVPPVNLVGDFGGGGMLMAFGVVCGVLKARSSGRGQVIDAAMIDGASVLATMIYALRADGTWHDEPGVNTLDTGAHFYDVYETRDGKHVSVGAIEPQFYADLIEGLGLADDPSMPHQGDRDRWPEARARIAEVFRSKTREEWNTIFEGRDACYAPVLTIPEAARHDQVRHRGTVVERSGVLQPAPAPRFSETPGSIQGPTPHVGEHSREILLEAGYSASDIASMLDERIVAQSHHAPS